LDPRHFRVRSSLPFRIHSEEVEAFQAVLDKSNSEITTKGNNLKKEYEDIFKKGQEMGVKDNAYTKLTLEDLAKSRSVLDAAVSKRTEAFKAELARQRANEALCKEFAGVADPFVKSLVDAKDKITASKAELEEQLKYVKSRITQLPDESKKLGPINALQAKMEAAGITNNRYTTLVAKDVEVQFEQFQSFLTKKEKMLEEEIEHHKLRGITPEQFNEIDNVFKQFDTDNSKDIDKRELKACLYSLGEEKNKSEIDAILTKYGDKAKQVITYNGFREFMIDILGVSVTKDDILNAFALINKGDSATKQDKMEVVMDEPDIAYIKTTAPKAGDGWNYKSWTDDMFSR